LGKRTKKGSRHLQDEADCSFIFRLIHAGIGHGKTLLQHRLKPLVELGSLFQGAAQSPYSSATKAKCGLKPLVRFGSFPPWQKQALVLVWSSNGGKEKRDSFGPFVGDVDSRQKKSPPNQTEPNQEMLM
jgi:hypothetical protein